MWTTSTWATRWNFNRPGAPHFGGTWERLVRSCKKAVLAILRNRRMTLPMLTTRMCLVEQTLNAKPLVALSDDPEDLGALTRNHFLLGWPAAAQPLMLHSARYIDCWNTYKVTQSYKQTIWNRWAKEYYLPKLNVQPKWATDDERVLKVGDLVWLIDESVRRPENKMVQVTEVFPGADGVIQSESVNSSSSAFGRPAVKLAPVFFVCFGDGNRVGDVSARDLENNKALKIIELRKIVWYFELIWNETLTIALLVVISICCLPAYFAPGIIKIFWTSTLTLPWLSKCCNSGSRGVCTPTFRPLSINFAILHSCYFSLNSDTKIWR